MAERAQAGLDQLLGTGLVDPSRVAAIGYCFGGSTVQALAYSGAPLAGIVSFHGGLIPATADAVAKNKAKILICHGALDPSMKPEQIDAYLKSLDDGKVDYEFVRYAGALPRVHEPGRGQDRRGEPEHEGLHRLQPLGGPALLGGHERLLQGDLRAREGSRPQRPDAGSSGSGRAHGATEIRAPKAPLRPRVVTTLRFAPEAKTRPSFMRRAWVKAGMISSAWWVTRTSDGPAAAPGEHVHEAQEFLAGDRVQPRAGLVEDEEPRPGHERAGDQHPLALALRKVSPFPLGEGQGADGQEEPPRRGVVAAGGPHPEVQLGVAAADDRLQRRLGRRDRGLERARHDPDLQAQVPPVRLAVVPPEERELAGGRGQVARDRTKERRLAAAVRPEDDPVLPLADAPVDAAQDFRAPAGDAQAR